MKQFLFWVLLTTSGAIAQASQPIFESSAFSQAVNSPTAIASPSNLSTQILSPNA
ncbi:hypothetical protein [Nostoc sp.]|uniref:hypothetical protein n=1 Tax=Nostoc sp. TaxID=1180 RepID=UPI002FFB7340